MVVRRMIIWKRREILIALCAVVIPSAADGLSCTASVSHRHCRETTPWCYVFLLSHILRLSVCKEDFSLTLEMTIRKSDISQFLSLLVSWSLRHRSLLLHPHKHHLILHIVVIPCHIGAVLDEEDTAAYGIAHVLHDSDTSIAEFFGAHIACHIVRIIRPA